jgi:hypothetical protein
VVTIEVHLPREHHLALAELDERPSSDARSLILRGEGRVVRTNQDLGVFAAEICFHSLGDSGTSEEIDIRLAPGEKFS